SPAALGLLLVILIALVAGTAKGPRLTSIVIWSFAATVFVSAALMLALPGPFRDKVLWLSLMAPLTWVALQFWCCWDAREWRVTLGLITVSAIAAVFVFLSPSPV
ncbi:MAG: hypothetical protein MI723_03155, partial [Caulobacterales bacterium]|nr:hypothetical protein [Caulobacterales bacterium]